MAHPKRRVYQHIMEDQSLCLVKQLLPDEWVIREYKPDYGIDLAIELFKYTDEAKDKADALGEFIFVQLKSIRKTQIQKLTVYSKSNVEKFPHSPQKRESLKIDVVPFKIDVNELLTIQAMGVGVPVILFLVCLDINKVFFVCLNDLIDKVLIPESPNFINQESKVIYVPTKNELNGSEKSLIPLLFYAKRPKLYSAFCKFAYQENELSYLLDKLSISPSKELLNVSALETILHFIRIILRYDFWESTEMWIAIHYSHKEILSIKNLLEKLIHNKTCSLEDLLLNYQVSADSIDFDSSEYFLFFIRSQISFCWAHLKNLSNIYEEICREWLLPTFFAQLLF